ncbi:mechanosensitive ion channel family protein [Plastoroseomonas hellenica]|uniref:mechanosensitive ion channel family protein n=1 Tax=Plastoroseomonas hellenica TaxID=2687306 RepID=UPI001BA64E70|nr:mechanosensitive ion channel family protein [Plastoroseomonas hellenica]MBR0643027.1 mechanosensitive ion channel family protein [Plastoroseomonas hellenica]
MLDELDEAARDAVASFAWAPAWAVSTVLLVLAVAMAWFLHSALYRVLTRLVRDQSLFLRSLVSRSEGLVRFAIIIMAVSTVAGFAPLTQRQTGILRQVLAIGFICLLGWVARSALNIWSVVHLRRFKLDSEDNLLARKHTTQFRILQRVGSFLILTITVAAALMTVDSVRQYGVSLLASAGAAGLVVGLALQPLLKNVMAGIQLAITQPIRLEDAVIVENEWGNVEEIATTYVVVRLWDWRRMVLPLSYFIEKPFQNWTRESSSLLGSVSIHLDYTAPVEAMRRKLEEIVERSALWDRQVAVLQVVEFRQDTMEVRMLVSASNAGRAFDLRCEVRETMIAWLQAEHPGALPRRRAEVAPLPEGGQILPERRGLQAAGG